MKTGNRWIAAVVAVLIGTTLTAGVALAGGGKVRQHNGNGYGATPRTGALSASIQRTDRTQSRLRVGRYGTSADRARVRLRDGSCRVP